MPGNIVNCIAGHFLIAAVNKNEPLKNYFRNLKLYKMKVAVWDTYVTKKDGTIMHFDIIAPAEIKDEKTIHTFGKDYLLSKNQEGQSLAAKECSFCHTEAATAPMEAAIEAKGYYIIEMQNCT